MYNPTKRGSLNNWFSVLYLKHFFSLDVALQIVANYQVNWIFIIFLHVQLFVLGMFISLYHFVHVQPLQSCEVVHY